MSPIFRKCKLDEDGSPYRSQQSAAVAITDVAKYLSAVEGAWHSHRGDAVWIRQSPPHHDVVLLPGDEYEIADGSVTRKDPS